MSITWHMFGGHDFTTASSSSFSSSTLPDLCSDECPCRSAALKHARSSASNNINRHTSSSSSSPTSQQLLKTKSHKVHTTPLPAGAGRDTNKLLQLSLSKVRFVYDEYSPEAEHHSRFVLLVNNLEMIDKVSTSAYNKLLYQFNSPTQPRPSNVNMVTIKAVQTHAENDDFHYNNSCRNPTTSSPDQASYPSSSDLECLLKISVLPIRLHIDQDSLVFLRTFFLFVTSSSSRRSSTGASASPGGFFSQGTSSSPLQHLSGSPSTGTPPKPSFLHPVTAVSPPRNDLHQSRSPAAASTSINPDGTFLIFDEIDGRSGRNGNFSSSPDSRNGASSRYSVAADGSTTAPVAPLPTFFKHFIFSPELTIRFDYHGKKPDFEQGTLAGLLFGLAQLNCSEISLKKIDTQKGFVGLDKLLRYCIGEWINDIQRNQIGSILTGVGPLYSIKQIVEGVIDLFWYPIEECRPGGNIVLGLRKGARAFSTNTATAVLELAQRLVGALQFTADLTYNIVSPSQMYPPCCEDCLRKQQRGLAGLGHKRPVDLRTGFVNARDMLYTETTSQVHRVKAVTATEYESNGIAAASGAIIREMPSNVIRPLCTFCKASATILDGMRNQLQPELYYEDEQKYRLASIQQQYRL